MLQGARALLLAVVYPLLSPPLVAFVPCGTHLLLAQELAHIASSPKRDGTRVMSIAGSPKQPVFMTYAPQHAPPPQQTEGGYSYQQQYAPPPGKDYGGTPL